MNAAPPRFSAKACIALSACNNLVDLTVTRQRRFNLSALLVAGLASGPGPPPEHDLRKQLAEQRLADRLSRDLDLANREKMYEWIEKQVIAR